MLQPGDLCWQLAALGNNRATIAEAGAIKPLVGLLATGATDAQKFATGALWHLAYRDGITGLWNRRQYELHLGSTTARGSPFAVLLADIDHFRIINDGYGHQFGDQVIASVAARLRQQFYQQRDARQ